MDTARARRTAAIAFAVMVQSGCDGPKIGPPEKIIRIGDSQTATVGTAVPVAPAVVIQDANGRGVPGITVTFSVGTGGGLISGPTAQTDKSGTATVGSWTLGTVVGSNTLVAGATGVPGSPATFSAVGTAGATTTLTKIGSEPLTAPGGGNVDSIAVLAADKFGNPVPGQTVSFSVTAGGGSVSPTSRVTLADGRAAARWTLGPDVDVQNTAVASRPDGTLPVTFTTRSARDIASVRFAEPVMVVDSLGNVTAGVAAYDRGGNAVAGATLDVRTRNANIATALGNSSGVSIHGNRAGQVFVVATSLDVASAADSTLVIVGNIDAPVVRMTVPRFDLRADTTFTVSLILDIRSSAAIGAATLNVAWNPSVLTFQGEESPAVNGSVIVNAASAASGFLSLAFASGTGVTGAVELRKLTFRASATTGRSGLLTANVVDMATAGTLTSLVPRTVSGVFPLRIR